MSTIPDIPVLHGRLVRLEPLSARHGSDLAAAAEEDRSSYGFTVIPREWEVAEYLATHFELAAAGRLAPFAQVRQRDGRAVRSTAYWDPRSLPDRAELYAVEIGWTWRGAARGGPLPLPRPAGRRAGSPGRAPRRSPCNAS